LQNTLQQAGFIKYRRGHIQIVDVEGGAKAGACECYGQGPIETTKRLVAS